MDFLQKISKNTKVLYLLLGTLLTVVLVGLLFYRFPTHDETIYLQETYLMSELLNSGVWVGDYGVGIHGFILKLPLALVFMLTGPSALLATLFNYLFIGASLFLMYKVAKHFFKFDLNIFISILLLALSFEFVRSAPTYLREIPSLFSVLLFTLLYLKKTNRWWLGLSMLLVLDAKEYMFFVIGLAYAISESLIVVKEGLSVKKVLNLVFDYIKVFLPSIVFILLMFTTSIIPLNMFLASILGLIDKGFKYNVAQFSSEIGATNVTNSGDIKEIFSIGISTGIVFIDSIIEFINKLIGYFGKFLYPRSFSYTSISRLIMIPVLVTGILQLKEWFSKKDSKMFIVISLFIFMAIFILRNSHGRYLFSISPFIFILFTIFLSTLGNNLKQSIWIIAFAWLIESLGLYFETSWAVPKMFVSLIILLLYIGILYINTRKREYKDFSLLFVGASIGVITMISSLTFLYSQGQIYDAMKFGREFEAQKIINHIEKYDRVFINDTRTGQLLPFYFKETHVNPLWKWNLKPYLPKQHLVKYFGDDSIERVGYIPLEELKEKGTVLVLFDSKIKSIEFVNEKAIPSLLQNPKYELIEKIELKGKDMYIFKYNEGNN